MNKKNVLLGLAGVLILLGLIKPDLSNLLNSKPSVVVDVLELSAPTDPEVKSAAEEVTKILSSVADHKYDSRRLRDLYLDLSRLVELDGEDMVVKNTEDIRQANSLAGAMCRLDIKGKYTNLADAAKKVMVTAIGDDQIVLSPELRVKAVDAFKALAWACNESSK
jgi:hypothetical protein